MELKNKTSSILQSDSSIKLNVHLTYVPPQLVVIPINHIVASGSYGDIEATNGMFRTS